MQQNPYAPPQSDVDGPIQAPGPQNGPLQPRPGLQDLASKSCRFVGHLIDAVFLWPLLVGLVREFAVLILLSPLFFAVYYVVCESAFGRTLGKLITGTRVVAVSGQHPGGGQIIVRTLIRYIPFEPFSFLSKEPGGWHDWWSDTWVVRVRRPRRAAPAPDSSRDGSISAGS